MRATTVHRSDLSQLGAQFYTRLYYFRHHFSVRLLVVCFVEVTSMEQSVNVHFKSQNTKLIVHCYKP